MSSTPLTVAVDNTQKYTDVQEKLEYIRNEYAKGNETPFAKTISFIGGENVTQAQKQMIAAIYGMDVKTVTAALQNFTRNKKVLESLNKIPENQYEYVTMQMDKWRADMTYQGIFTARTGYHIEGMEVSEEDFKNAPEHLQQAILDQCPITFTFNTMWQRLIKEAALLKLPYTERAIERALTDWMEQKRNFIYAAAKDRLKHEPHRAEAGAQEWELYVALLSEKNFEETLVVMKHFVWQVKRKMFGLPVTNHMMPVFSGKQGTGKSTAIKLLTDVIGEFTGSTNFKAIADDRYHDIWKNYVLVFDEMGYGSTTEIDVVKNKITSDHFTSRVLGVNSGTQVINNATFIGSTNKDLSRLIFDETGMRRFFQVEFRDIPQWEHINKIDYALLWQSIDEKADTPLQASRELFASVRSVQEAKRFKPLIEQFLEDREYIGNNGIEYVDALLFYAEFQAYELQHQPRNEMTNTKFGRDVCDIASRIPGLAIVKERSRKGARYLIQKE